MRVCSSRTWITALAVIGLVLAAQPAKAAFTFSDISNNTVANATNGESQLFMTVNAGPNAGQATFSFYNIGPNAMSITDIYFDDGGRKPAPPPNKPAAGNLIVSIASLNGSSGVSFTTPATPGDLPSGNNATPQFVTTLNLSANSTAPAQPNGVNPGESLSVVVNLASGKSYADVLAELNNGLGLNGSSTSTDLLNSLRVGIHVQGFVNGGSESFINGDTDGGGAGNLDLNPVPAPAGLILLASGLPILGLRRLLRRKAVAA